MKTKDGYKVTEGMWLSTETDSDKAFYIKSVSDDTAVYNEYEWDEENEYFVFNGGGGLLCAEEIAEEYEYM